MYAFCDSFVLIGQIKIMSLFFNDLQFNKYVSDSVCEETIKSAHITPYDQSGLLDSSTRLNPTTPELRKDTVFSPALWRQGFAAALKNQ
jgi:hypothetical protein